MIVKIDNISELTATIDPDVLVIFDVDDVLFHPVDAILQTQHAKTAQCFENNIDENQYCTHNKTCHEVRQSFLFHIRGCFCCSGFERWVFLSIPFQYRLNLRKVSVFRFFQTGD